MPGPVMVPPWAVMSPRRAAGLPAIGFLQAIRFGPMGEVLALGKGAGSCVVVAGPPEQGELLFLGIDLNSMQHGFGSHRSAPEIHIAEGSMLGQGEIPKGILGVHIAQLDLLPTPQVGEAEALGGSVVELGIEQGRGFGGFLATGLALLLGHLDLEGLGGAKALHEVAGIAVTAGVA